VHCHTLLQDHTQPNMAQITIKGLDAIGRNLEKTLSETVEQLSQRVFETAKANTPIRSGNARRNWTKLATKDNFEVANRVPYIERLEAGASRQAPRGIIGPTLTQVKGKL
jgi:hypothetical protein